MVAAPGWSIFPRMLATDIARTRAPPSAVARSALRSIAVHHRAAVINRSFNGRVLCQASTSGRDDVKGVDGSSSSRRRSRIVPRVHARRIEAMSGSHDEDELHLEGEDDDAPGPVNSSRSIMGSADPGAPLGVVLTHVSADFDTLSSAVGLAKLRNARLGANCTFVVLPRGASPGVSHYLALHKNKFPIKEKRVVEAGSLAWAAVVDAQRRDRIGDCDKWLDAAKEVVVLDHHLLATSDIDATELIVEDVGATATIVAEMLENENVPITEEDATLLALGIHTDTGSLTFEATTPRDADALAYCLRMGASQKVLAEYVNPSLTAEQREVIARGMTDVKKTTVEGITVSRVHVECEEYCRAGDVRQGGFGPDGSGRALHGGSYVPARRTRTGTSASSTAPNRSRRSTSARCSRRTSTAAGTPRRRPRRSGWIRRFLRRVRRGVSRQRRGGDPRRWCDACASSRSASARLGT